MAQFMAHIERRRVYFSDHALDRWWERCRANHVNGRQDALDLLRCSLGEGEWRYKAPSWARLSLWHRARCEGHLLLGDGAFIVNRNATGDLVAVSYIEPDDERLAA
jgi:hypothetical protein